MYETTLFGLFWHLKRLSLWVYYKIAPHVFIIYCLFGPCETRNYLLYLVAVWWGFKKIIYLSFGIVLIQILFTNIILK